MQLERGSVDGTMSIAEHRIRVGVQGDLEKTGSARTKKEDKIEMNRYKTQNSTVRSVES